jgi:hypothetical protein
MTLWRMAFRGSCLAACALAMALAPRAGDHRAAQRQEPLPTELAWIGLYNQALLDWLENENRLDTLCPTGAAAECRDEQMQPMAAIIPLHAEPRADASRLGEILVVAVPGKGLSAFASAKGRIERFTPDLYDRDWGYGPFFHQTLLERRGAWFRVPVPGAGRVWIDAAAWTDARALEAPDGVLRTLRAGDIVTTRKGDVVVLSVSDGVLRARAEQDADMWCRPGEPPARVDGPEIRMPFAELFDTDGHLRVRFKYTRGC